MTIIFITARVLTFFHTVNKNFKMIAMINTLRPNFMHLIKYKKHILPLGQMNHGSLINNTEKNFLTWLIPLKIILFKITKLLQNLSWNSLEMYIFHYLKTMHNIGTWWCKRSYFIIWKIFKCWRPWRLNEFETISKSYRIQLCTWKRSIL